MEENLKELARINREKKELEKREKEIKEKVQPNLTKDGLKNDFVIISYIEASESTTVDLSKLEEKEPDLYKDLLKDYPKITKRNSSFRYTFK